MIFFVFLDLIKVFFNYIFVIVSFVVICVCDFVVEVFF